MNLRAIVRLLAPLAVIAVAVAAVAWLGDLETLLNSKTLWVLLPLPSVFSYRFFILRYNGLLVSARAVSAIAGEALRQQLAPHRSTVRWLMGAIIGVQSFFLIWNSADDLPPFLWLVNEAFQLLCAVRMLLECRRLAPLAMGLALATPPPTEV